MQVGQIKKLLNYPRIAKSFGYDKKINTIFAEVTQLVQRLQLAVTEQRTIWESITLVIAFDKLHDDFEMITTPLLHFSDKDLEEIQQIVISTKVANLIKCVVRTKANLALMAKKRQPERAAIKFKPGEKGFNCRKKDHYIKNNSSSISNKKKLAEESTEKTKRS